MQKLRAKAQERKEEQPRLKEKKLGRIPLRERLRRKDSIAENRARAQKCRTQSEARFAICRAGSSSTLGHASLARRRLVFDCFQGLQNFLPARGAGLFGVAFAQA